MGTIIFVSVEHENCFIRLIRLQKKNTQFRMFRRYILKKKTLRPNGSCCYMRWLKKKKKFNSNLTRYTFVSTYPALVEIRTGSSKL